MSTNDTDTNRGGVGDADTEGNADDDGNGRSLKRLVFDVEGYVNLVLDNPAVDTVIICRQGHGPTGSTPMREVQTVVVFDGGEYRLSKPYRAFVCDLCLDGLIDEKGLHPEEVPEIFVEGAFRAWDDGALPADPFTFDREAPAAVTAALPASHPRAVVFDPEDDRDGLKLSEMFGSTHADSGGGND